jgi:hypothetical protein
MAVLFASDTIIAGYKDALQERHKGSNWGSTAVKYSGGLIADVIRPRGYLQTALDYGCGKGTLAQEFPQLEWSEYDPGIPGKDTKPKGQFDLVTCTDVLEHVEPQCIDAVVAELAAYTGKVLVLDIACYPTGETFTDGPYKGQDVHILVREPDWWADLLETMDLQLFQYSKIKRRTKRAYRERAQFIYERV